MEPSVFENLPKSWINSTVIERFQKIVHQYPTKTALISREKVFNYKELNQAIELRKNQLNAYIHSDRPIAIWMNIDPEFIITKFACLSLGIPHVPLDSNFPIERNRAIIKHSGAQCIVTTREFSESIHQIIDTPALSIDDNLNKLETTTYAPSTQSIAYIIYTSGSTGKPKGVFQNQTNLLHDVWQYINSIQLCHEDRSSYCYSPSVNGSIRDTYGTLLVGGTLYLTNLKKYSIHSLKDYLVDNNITIFHAIPTIFRTLFLLYKNVNFPNVRLIYLAGDRIFRSDYEIYKTNFNDQCLLYVGIGSTENATLFRQWLIDKQTVITSNLIPVGYPIVDRNMSIQNENGNIVEPGTVGEIVVRSKYMALGYWNDETLTKNNFTFHSDGSREFRTGDLAKESTNGLLEFIGRKDNQFKINGHRIEIDEIRAIILSLEEVDNTAIIQRKTNEQTKIVAYIQTNGNEEKIKEKIKHLLPDYMFPTFFYFVSEIPLLSNYKLDVKEIERLDKELSSAEKLTLSNSNTIEAKIQAIWTKYTGNVNYSTEINWSETGANSIDLLNFIVELEKSFNIHIPTDFVYSKLSPNLILHHIENRAWDVKAQDFKEKPIIYFFPWLCGIPDGHEKLIRKLSKQYDVQLIAYPRYKNWKKNKQTFKQVCSDIENFLSSETRPIVFFGVLSGSLFSHEIAYTLKQNHQKECLMHVVLDYAPLNLNVFQKLKRTIKNKLTNHYTSAQQRILHSSKISSSDINTTLFSFKNKSESQQIAWKPFCSKLKTVSFNFTHKELAGNNRHEKISNNEAFIQHMENEFLKLIEEVVK